MEHYDNNKIPLSFIILRHLSTKNHNIYWNVCYDNIRKIYKTEPIYIIDDNSKFPPFRIGEKLINTKIINSGFPPNRGELLPYYYFYKFRFSKNTVILHDTVFIHRRIDPKLLNTKFYHFLWWAEHKWDNDKRILDILKKMDNHYDLIKLYKNKSSWDICFGGLAVLNLDYISSIFNNKNYLDVLLREIKSRDDRMCFERIISILLTKNKNTHIICGNIHQDQKWGTLITNYYQLKNTSRNKVFTKIWISRGN